MTSTDPPWEAEPRCAAQGNLTLTWGNGTTVFTGHKIPGVVMTGAVLSDGALVQMLEGDLIRLDAGGKERWRKPMPRGQRLAVASDGSIRVAASRELVSLDKDGKQQWSVKLTDLYLGQPLVDGEGATYVTDGKSVFAVDSAGRPRWTFPAVFNRHIYALGMDDAGRIIFRTGTAMAHLPEDEHGGRIYIAGVTPELLHLDRATGKVAAKTAPEPPWPKHRARPENGTFLFPSQRL
jgi:hypothetical protein